MGVKYHTIYADPPWMERGGGKIKRGADRHYPLMDTEEIMALDVKSIAADDCWLYLWVTNNFLQDGLDVMKAWGFKFKTVIAWVKVKDGKLQIGLGQYFRGASELCLFGTKGHLPYKTDENGKRMQGVTAILAERTRHSKKPPEMRAMIERVSYGPFVELFAREPHPGWDVWGNEVESEIEI